MPKVTIVMPVYNGEAFIRDALDSILQQSFTDWECIVVNEWGSDDGSARTVRHIAERDERIIFLQAKERMGAAGMLNMGLDMAKGAYVVRIDVNDLSEPERLAKQVAYMDAHPEVSVCGCLEYTVTPEKSYLCEAVCEAEELKAAMLFGCEISRGSVMMRKQELDSHEWRYDPSSLDEDYDLWQRMLTAGAIFANIPEPLVSHRAGFDSANAEKNAARRRQVGDLSVHMLQALGIQTDKFSPSLFYEQDLSEPVKAEERTLLLKEGYRLFQQIIEKNEATGYCDGQALQNILFQRWDRIRERCGLRFKKRRYGQFQKIATTPVVSVVLPTFRSAADISCSIDSIQDQTFADWELLVINDLGSDDGTVEIVRMYAQNDPRVRLIQAEKRLGLAESLNEGLRQARGKYIARLDADDTSAPERFAKQVAYMDAHPEVGICGSWQHHYGDGADWVHMAQPDPKRQRCQLLFWCDLCHSTLMLRRDMFIENHLFYDPDAQAEDFELWTRAMMYMQIANLPEVLGEYKEGTGITANKIQALNDESGRITARVLRQTLDIHVPYYETHLFNSWRRGISKDKQQKQLDLARLREIFRTVWEKNETVGFFDSQCLLQTLAAKWHWCLENRDWRTADYSYVTNIEEALADEYPKQSGAVKNKKAPAPKQTAEKPPTAAWKRVCKRLLRRPMKFLRRVMKSLLRDSLNELKKDIKKDVDRDVKLWTGKRMKTINKMIEEWTWDRYQRQEKALDTHIKEAEKNAAKTLDSRMWKAEQNVTQTMDARVWKAEQSITQTMDSRMWKAEQNVTQTLDARVWKAEQNVTQTMDARVWKAEQNINQTTDARVWKAEQNVTQTLDGRIWSAEQNILHLQKNGLRLQAASMLGSEDQARRIFLIGTPEHNNIGDAAIVNGEIEFVRRYFPGSRLIDIPDNDLGLWYEAVRTTIRPGDMIFLQGGGNMGSRYLREESVRRQVIGDFRDCSVVILPQTAYYDDSEAGRKELATTAAIFAGHPHLTILARGDRSLELMREHFPGAKSACVPDMALLLEKDYGLERKGVLLCIRALNDESGLTDSQYAAVMAAAREIDGQAENTDNLYQGGYEGRIWQDMRREVVEQQLRRFASSQVVVTDRLHGLIFALITHTPCVVFSSYNYKIGEFCRTFVHTDGVIFLDNDVERLPAAIRTAMEHGPLESTGVDFGLYAQAQRMIQEDTGWV